MITETFTMRRYLALHLPGLSAERAVRANFAPPDAAFALTATLGGTDRIVAVSAAVDADLIGLPLADARARVPTLRVVTHDAAADRALLEWLADGCEIFSPTVALDPPDGVIIDITGCDRFADEGDLSAAIDRRLRGAGLTASLAFGPTPDAAAALARFGVATVADLPIAALRVDDAIRSALRRTGLTTVGALAARPRAPLAARFGTIVATLLGRLLGEEDVRLVPRRSPSPFVAERRFAEPVAAYALVRTTLDQLMTVAGEQLAARGMGGRRFEAALFRTDGHVARLTLDTGAPTRDPVVVARLLAERIDALADPLDPGFGYDVIRFTVPVAEALGPAQLRLDGAVSADAAMTLLIDRLTTRLGSGRVRRLVHGDSHIPEQATFDAPATIAASAWPTSPPDEPPHRPLHLFTPPQPIEVLAEVPDGPPRGFRWQRLRHEVTRAEGPERIAAEWWHHANSGTTRDYYRLEDSVGRRFWVFRHGLYGSEKANPRWYLHGIFA